MQKFTRFISYINFTCFKIHVPAHSCGCVVMRVRFHVTFLYKVYASINQIECPCVEFVDNLIERGSQW